MAMILEGLALALAKMLRLMRCERFPSYVVEVLVVLCVCPRWINGFKVDACRLTAAARLPRTAQKAQAL